MINSQQLKVYYDGEDGYRVRQMQLEEGLLAAKWFQSDGKFISKYDLQCAIKAWSPGPGFFIGEKHGKPISCKVMLNIGDDLHYGSMAFVTPEERGKGYQNIIYHQVAKKVAGKNRHIVDSLSNLVESNKRKGYVETNIKIARFSGIAKEYCKISPNVKKVTSHNLDALVAYDNKCYFTSDFPPRKKLLEQWIDIPGGQTFAYFTENGQVIGFGCRRPSLVENHHRYGPIYAEHPDIAKELISALSQDISGAHCILHTSMANTNAVELFKELDFTEDFNIPRMSQNGTAPPIKDSVYGITSLDFCGY